MGHIRYFTTGSFICGAHQAHGETFTCQSKREEVKIKKFKMSLSFKVTLIKENDQETRRFVLNEDTATSFSNIQQKITSIFPALDEREPVVSWLDDEGDEVRMANDEELKLADLTPLLGPIQAEQLSQLLTTVQGSQLQEQLPQLGGLISTFLGPAALEAVFPVLEALAKTQSVQPEAQQESETEQKKTREGSLEEEKASQSTEAEKEKLEEMDVEESDEEKVDSDFEVIPASSPRSSIYPTLPTEERARLWKTNPMDSTNVGQEGKEDIESVKSAENMSEQNDPEDPGVAGALAQMKAMGFSDDGGWLSNLLKAKSGDVGKVLDAIQPNRQQ